MQILKQHKTFSLLKLTASLPVSPGKTDCLEDCLYLGRFITSGPIYVI